MLPIFCRTTNWLISTTLTYLALQWCWENPTMNTEITTAAQPIRMNLCLFTPAVQIIVSQYFGHMRTPTFRCVCVCMFDVSGNVCISSFTASHKVTGMSFPTSGQALAKYH